MSQSVYIGASLSPSVRRRRSTTRRLEVDPLQCNQSRHAALSRRAAAASPITDFPAPTAGYPWPWDAHGRPWRNGTWKAQRRGDLERPTRPIDAIEASLSDLLDPPLSTAPSADVVNWSLAAPIATLSVDDRTLGVSGHRGARPRISVSSHGRPTDEVGSGMISVTLLFPFRAW